MAGSGIAEPVDQGVGPPGRADPVGGLEVADVLVYGQRVVQDDRLRAVARLAVGHHASPVGTEVTSQDAEQGGLPAAVLADHRDHLPGRDGQVHPGQHLVPAERLADSPRFQDAHGPVPFLTPCEAPVPG
jgi:hypothetical protein